MDKKQAEQLIRQVCSNFRGTLEEHNAIQQALSEVFKNDEEN